jgi:hypothetical protein
MAVATATRPARLGCTIPHTGSAFPTEAAGWRVPVTVEARIRRDRSVEIMRLGRMPETPRFARTAATGRRKPIAVCRPALRVPAAAMAPDLRRPGVTPTRRPAATRASALLIASHRDAAGPLRPLRAILRRQSRPAIHAAAGAADTRAAAMDTPVADIRTAVVIRSS